MEYELCDNCGTPKALDEECGCGPKLDMSQRAVLHRVAAGIKDRSYD